VTRVTLAALFGLALVGVTGGQPPGRAAGRDWHWRAVLADRVPVYGHRNWIVVADAAYPAQTRAGIEVVVTEADHLRVLRAVLDELADVKHVRPAVHLDAELPHVPEKDAPGIGDYRRELKSLLADNKPQSVLHEQLLDRLDKAGEKYKVLVLKTDSVLPYSSVFIELDSGYWSADAEKRLREAMNPGKGR
jgi:L-fucose mutarotase/ribose pyranase (RbsD/FucU family)